MISIIKTPEKQASRRYTVSLFVEVTDEQAVIATGIEVLTREGIHEDEARDDIGSDVAKALRYILDPGSLKYPGVEIHDSACEVSDT